MIVDVYVPMGITAENVAQRYDISRTAMDEFALASHLKAIAAIDEANEPQRYPGAPLQRHRRRT